MRSEAAQRRRVVREAEWHRSLMAAASTVRMRRLRVKARLFASRWHGEGPHADSR